MEDQLVAAGGGVDLLLQGLEADAPLLEQRDGVDEVSERAAQPVEPSDDEGVAGAQEAKCLVQPRTHDLVAAGGVGEQAFTAGLSQGVLSEGGRELFSTCVALLFDELTDEDRGEQGGGA